jgi:hypothetical protein
MRMLIELAPQYYESLLSRVTEESPLYAILKNGVKVHRNTDCGGDSDIIAIVLRRRPGTYASQSLSTGVFRSYLRRCKRTQTV